MSKKDEALKQALEWYDSGKEDRQEFETLMRRLLAEQPAQQTHCNDCGGFDPECPLAQPAQQQARKTSYEELERIADDLQELCDKQAIRLGKLEAQQQEPIAWIERDMQCDDYDPDSVTCEKPDIAADGWEWVPLYTSPQPSKPWVGLTDEERNAIGRHHAYVDNIIRATEAKLREKNNG